MTSSTPRLAAADRLLLRSVFAWSRENGWRHNWEDMGDGRRAHRWSTGGIGAVTLFVDGDAFLFCWADSIQVESAREAVDVLVALGILDVRFSSAFAAGRESATRCGHEGDFGPTNALRRYRCTDEEHKAVLLGRCTYRDVEDGTYLDMRYPV